jgi:hypothetical protein
MCGVPEVMLVIYDAVGIVFIRRSVFRADICMHFVSVSWRKADVQPNTHLQSWNRFPDPTLHRGCVHDSLNCIFQLHRHAVTRKEPTH